MVTLNTLVDGQVKAPDGQADGATPTTPQTVTETPATTDYKAETERLTGELATLQRRLDTMTGRARTNVPDQTLARIETEMKRLGRELRRRDVEDSVMEASAKTQALRAIQQEEQTDQESVRFTSHATRLANRLNARLEKATFLRGNTGLQDLLAKWNQSTNIDQVDDAYDALDDFIDGELDKYTKAEIKTANDKVAQERTRANRANNTLEVGAPTGGMPAGITPVTRDNIDGLYVAWDREHPNTKNPYEDRYRVFVRTGELN